jgi:hypothetical protein
MAKNNAGTLIAVVVVGVLIYMLVKGRAFKSSASGSQTAGTRATGVPTNPFASALSKLGLQLPTQFGVGTPADIGSGDVSTINMIADNPGVNLFPDTSGDLSNAPNPFNNFGFSPGQIATGSYT